MNQLEQLCIDRGMRMSEQRRAILQVIDEARDHPNAEEIYLRARKKDNRICLATIYRTVHLLTESGLLNRLELGDGKVRYEEMGEEHHEHLLDIRSGAIVEFQSPGIEDLIRQAANALGYTLRDYRLEVFAEPHASPDAPTDAAPSATTQSPDDLRRPGRGAHAHQGR